MTNADISEQIAKLMLASQWRGGDSQRELAEEHGKTIKHIQTLAREAAGALRLLSGDLPALVREEQAKLDMIFSMAIGKVAATKSGEIYPAPALREAIQAIELKAKLAGALNQPVNKTEPIAPVKPGDDARAVREKLLAAVAELDKQIAGEGMH